MARFRRGIRRRFNRSSKRRYRSILGFKSKRRYLKHKVKPIDKTLVNNTRPSLNIPINPRYLTKMTMSFAGNTQIATTAGGAGQFYVKLNSVHYPLQTTPSFVDASNLSGAFLATTPAISITSFVPRGKPNLLSANMYNRYRVYASKIKVTALPQDPSDSVVLTVIPLSNTVGDGGEASIAQNIAFSKERICTLQADNKDNTIIQYMDCPSLFGKTTEQYMADENMSAGYIANPVITAHWAVKHQRLAGGDYTDNISFNVEVVYYVECFEMNYESMTTVLPVV